MALGFKKPKRVQSALSPGRFRLSMKLKLHLRVELENA